MRNARIPQGRAMTTDPPKSTGYPVVLARPPEIHEFLHTCTKPSSDADASYPRPGGPRTSLEEIPFSPIPSLAVVIARPWGILAFLISWAVFRRNVQAQTYTYIRINTLRNGDRELPRKIRS